MSDTARKSHPSTFRVPYAVYTGSHTSTSSDLRRGHDAEAARVAAGDVRNPLKGLARDKLLADVVEYHRVKELPQEILRDLKKGALVAQNPDGFEDIPDLTEEDKVFLRDERDHKWRHPKPLYYTIIISSLAAAIQGWDQACIP